MKGTTVVFCERASDPTRVSYIGVVMSRFVIHTTNYFDKITFERDLNEIVSKGENSSLASVSAPLFTTLYPERDRNCHLMIQEHSDDGSMLSRPLEFRTGVPLDGLMTLRNFVDGGCDAVCSKILVVVKSIGAKSTGSVHFTL